MLLMDQNFSFFIFPQKSVNNTSYRIELSIMTPNKLYEITRIYIYNFHHLEMRSISV